MTRATTSPLNIVEPTLNSDAGHCMSLVRALSEAALHTGCQDIRVWGGRNIAKTTWTAPGQVRAHFVRRWRRFQALGLYRRLLREPGRILVSTAGSTDLVSLDWAARSCGIGRIPAHKVTLFVHWLNIKPGKARLYTAIARRQPELKILAPTASVADFFASCGFKTQVVPYPLDTANQDTQPEAHTGEFRHLLVPGSARMDKGFGHIVDLVEEMAKRQLSWPIIVQTSLEHGHDKDLELTEALARLQASDYVGLQLHHEAMDRETYRAQFQGAIVIQPYRAASFQDRVSGVTLDALQAGSPVVVTDGTWMARLAEKYKAGVATSDLTPCGLLNAIQTILNDHAGFAQRACAAATDVRSEHSARALIEAVLA
ncbi:MAG: glycosyltransferase [Aquabacterium sp.]|uniref:glycosyltransferase n=1 Tax=Aquabacterium sp. TaxID=1872578 RepID=UPI0025C64B0A|nr:glycosyltransferase [Aquabacterium sp.]MBI5924989.1 glycosyltransferase [Aquabacterium sp.]